MGAWFRTNLPYRVLSILLALGLWLYVVEDKNPAVEYVLSVPLEVRNLPADLVVSERPNTVKIRIEGREGLVRDVSSRDIHAFVEMHQPKEGVHLFPVQVSLPTGINLVNITPTQAEITVDKLMEKQVPVTVTFEGKAASGYKARDPVVQPSEIVVTGPGGFLEQINTAYVAVNLDGARNTIRRDLPVRVASDKDGSRAWDWVNLNPMSVEVTIPVVRDMPEKVVPIRADVKGEPARGHHVKNIILQPDVVSITGDQALLDTIDFVSTVPIELKGANKDLVQDLSLALPEKVGAVLARPVKVIVEISPIGANR
ncbi:MAG: YbbR-like domain-containing protein [Bacillota bacterium]